MVFESNIQIHEDAIFSKKYNNPVYIVLMHSGTPLANAIKYVTKDEFSHACIAFNSKLDPLYSFGTKGDRQSRGAGFSITSPKDSFFDKFSSKYSVYVMYVSDKAMAAMKNRMEYFHQNENKLGYDTIGLLNIWVGKDSEDHEKYFCSRFVMEIISKALPLDKLPSLWKPSDITQLHNISIVNKGFNFYNYDSKITDMHCKNIQKGKYDPRDVIYEAVSNKAIKDFESKKDMSLSSFHKMGINDSIIQNFKESYPSLSSIRVNKHTKGYVWLKDNTTLVGVVNVEEKDDDYKWITALEVFEDFRGHGLAKQILDVAVKQLDASCISVNKDNQVAIKIYKSYGFKKYKETDSLIFMNTRERSANESTSVIESDDYKETAMMAQQKLEQLQRQQKMLFCSFRDIEPEQNGWVFAEYCLEGTGARDELLRYIQFINKITETSIYPGFIKIPENMNIGSKGTLVIEKQSVYGYNTDEFIDAMKDTEIYNMDNGQPLAKLHKGSEEVQEKTKFYKNPSRRFKTNATRRNNTFVRAGNFPCGKNIL